MGEADARPVELEDPRVERARQSSLGRSPRSRFDDLHRRASERRDHARNLESRRSEPIEALVHERLEIRRHRQLGAWVDRAASPLERARELEGEEWIAAGRLPDAQERRPWKN